MLLIVGVVQEKRGSVCLGTEAFRSYSWMRSTHESEIADCLVDFGY